MGILISRFRKKKTTIEVLENLDKQIKEIEQYGQSTEQRHKRIVGMLILYSVALYTIAAVIFYFYFFPASLYDQLFYITPLLIFPFLMLLTKKMVTLYYKRKISRNQTKLASMQDEKKQILDEVTETETYKKAKEILLKFAPDQLRMTPLSPQVRDSKIESKEITPSKSIASAPSTPTTGNPALRDVSSLRRRTLVSAMQSPPIPRNMPEPPGTSNPFSPGFKSSVMSPPGTTPLTSGLKPYVSSFPAPQVRLPRPVLPQQRSYMDRLIEYLVGDGPSNRYALICRRCDSHNGMALKEEFEYFGFKCCYCGFFNSARKQKPSAPKLDMDTTVGQNSGIQELKAPALEREETENVLASSESDSDIEVVEKPGDTDRPSTEEEDEKEDKGSEEKPQLDESPEAMDIDESLSKK